MENVTLKINGMEVSAPKGSTILEAARLAHIEIPTLCFLKEINEKNGTTIILTSHYMEDIKALCQRTIVINHGMKIYDGTTEELFDRYQKNKKITVTFDVPVEDIKIQTQNVILIRNSRKLIPTTFALIYFNQS